MSQASRVRVTNREKWSKECLLTGQIIYIGSRADNDIAIQEATSHVEERHLLLRPSALNSYSYALVNLSSANLHHYPVGKGAGEIASEIVRPGASVELDHNHRVIFGNDHELVFSLGDQTSAMFELGVKMDGSTLLSPTAHLTGRISIKNIGNQNAAQFAVAVEGLPSECIDIEAGPMLFSGVQKEVAFRLKHPKQAWPLAGPEHPIRFHITADEAYPGEKAMLVQMIEIAPYLAHNVQVIGFKPGTLAKPIHESNNL